MGKVTTLFLKIAVILLGVPVLALCIFLVPELADVSVELLPEFVFIKVLVYIVFDASAIPFFFALYQAFKLLRNIDKNKAFSDVSGRSFKEHQILCDHHQCFTFTGFTVVLSLCASRRCTRSCACWLGRSICFRGHRSVCCGSPKTFTRCNSYQIRK